MDLIAGMYRALEVAARTGKPHIYPCTDAAGNRCVFVNDVHERPVDRETLRATWALEAKWYPRAER